MDKTFDVNNFIAGIGTDLVNDFEKARAATSPTAVGDVRGNPGWSLQVSVSKGSGPCHSPSLTMSPLK